MSNEELIAAARRAIEMLRLAGPLVGEFAPGEVRFYDGAECDGTCIETDCEDAAYSIEVAIDNLAGAQP